MAMSSIQTTEYIFSIFLSFYSRDSCYLSGYTLKRFGGLFDTPTCTRPENFPSFKHVWTMGSLYINATLIRRFCSVFLFEFLKRISTLCQIYWILDLQSLKLVCFEVKNTGRETMQISGCQWQNDVYSIEESVLPTRENTPNTGWILLILY